jgi:endo-1,4-beta-xylanase
MTLRLFPLCCLAAASLANASSLKESYDFAIGVAVSPDDVADPARQGLIKKNFNSLSFENVLKWDFVEPKEGEFHYELADKIVDFARANGMKLVGHTFVWHSQTPDWVFLGPDGKSATRELLLERLRRHIHDNALLGSHQ